MTATTSSDCSALARAAGRSGGTGVEALSARAPVSIRRDGCLRIRTRLSACSACAQVCPTAALRTCEGGLTLGTGCTGCGRCQAACPMGALAVDGFEFAEPEAVDEGDELVIDCRQVTPGAQGAGALRVPCLGGLSVGTLLALGAAHPERSVVLVDRGACRACASGGAEHPAQAAVARATELMRGCGVPAALWPQLRALPARRGRLRRADVEPLTRARSARRGLLQALVRPGAPGPQRTALPLRSAPSSERVRTLHSLRTLAARHGGTVPRELFHRIELSAECVGHRVCAAACATGALVRFRDAGTAGLAFDAASCIGCGDCAAACPGQALRVHRGAGDAGAGHHPLNRLARRECTQCGASFIRYDSQPDDRCPPCRTSAHLARSAFQILFGSRP